ncbi:MAG: glutamate 5-kinase [Pyrinomonadaceae bacterium]
MSEVRKAAAEESLPRAARLRAARRIVVKIGTRVVGAAGGEQFEELVAALAALKKGGRQVVLVSSGAVGLGASRLGLSPTRTRSDLTMRQACASVGQSLLMHAYEQLFRPHEIVPAQVLLTEADFTDHRRYHNLRRTMEKLLKLGVLPIVNENDTVSTAELEYIGAPDHARVFSDNDRLAALVMSRLEADALVLLTNVDGLLGSGRANERAVIPFVGEITSDIRALAAGRGGGRGGMITKLEAAEIAMRAGGVAVIANGTKPDTLERIFAGEEVGTAFMAGERMRGKRRWIAYAAGAHGRVVVNEGARRAIMESKASLLTSGLVRVESGFESAEVVVIADTDGREFARGIANCSSREAEEMLSHAGDAPRGKGRVLATRDNIVVFGAEGPQQAA